MGQYFRPIILTHKNTIKGWFNPYDTDNGAKMIEHSYINNELCCAVENYLIEKPARLIWAGDYANNENGMDMNLYQLASEKKDKHITNFNTSSLGKGWYVINYDMKEYYSRDNLPKMKMGDWIYTKNPLPMLTGEGIEHGGGGTYKYGPLR